MAIPNPIQTKIRNTKRYAELFEVMARHGFASFITETGLDRLIERGRELLGANHNGERVRHLPIKVRLRLLLEELGPTYIKMGQILSTRPDLIPPEISEEFRKLQSDCPQVDFAEIREELEREYPGTLDEIFATIEPVPLAAGSIAQTHRAVLVGGEKVVIKVKRPGIHEIIQSDIEILREVADFSERHFENLAFSPRAVLKEFSKEIRKELDFTREARSTLRLSNYFAESPNIKFPHVYNDISTENVLVLEEVQGVLLSRLREDQLTPDERRSVVENGTIAVFKMCLDYGFFHADPHPGNIFALPGGAICFIDLGMTGHIDQKTQTELAELVSGVVDGDLDKVLRITLAISDADPSMEFDRSFRSEAWDIITRFQVESLERLNLAELLNSIFDLLRTHGIRCPSDLVYLIKALATIQGVGAQVDPTFDLVGHVQPMIERLIRKQYGPAALKDRVMKSLAGYVEMMETLPTEIRSITSELRRRNFSLRMQHEGLDEFEDTVESASKHITIGVIIASMIVGSSIMGSASQTEFQKTFYSLVGSVTMLFAAFYAFNLWRSLRRPE